MLVASFDPTSHLMFEKMTLSSVVGRFVPVIDKEFPERVNPVTDPVAAT